MIRYGVPMEQYMAMKGISASLLHNVLAYSPLHARYWQQQPSEPSDASETGSAIHDALLEGMDRITVVDAQDWRTKAAKEARESARAIGNIPMLAHKVSRVESAVNAAREFVETTELAGIFERGKPEVTLEWSYDDMACKARPDWLTDDQDVILHVKTTAGSAHPESWIRSQLVQGGYDIAYAWYERGLFAQNGDGKSAPLSVFLVIEQNPPHGCSLVSLDPAMADLAERRMLRAFESWTQCMLSGKFPCYPSAICYAQPKPWQLAEEEEIAMGAEYDELQLKEGIQA